MYLMSDGPYSRQSSCRVYHSGWATATAVRPLSSYTNTPRGRILLEKGGGCSISPFPHYEDAAAIPPAMPHTSCKPLMTTGGSVCSMPDAFL